MNRSALDTLLSGQKYLLLQGPMGPFFRDLGNWLESKGREARQVIFNGGDRFYCRKEKSLPYQGTPEGFGAWLAATRSTWSFDTLVCFGDCRPLHQAARRWAQTLGIRFLVFEEGYLRPCFITLEENGVNGFSGLPREAGFYMQLPDIEQVSINNIVPSFWTRARHTCVYCIMTWAYQRLYSNYKHHKKLSLKKEAYCWTKAGWLKIWYRVTESSKNKKLKTELSTKYNLVILQVFNDSQMTFHSKYDNLEQYLQEVMLSFSNHAPPEQHLVIKHHPMDRGHKNYKKQIACLEKKYNIRKRVHYVHDLNLPDLIHHSRSVVTINSTVGLSALIHNKPLKVMGNAFYDIPGMTYPETLDKFWADKFIMEQELFKKFRSYLIKKAQINAVYYCKNSSWEEMLSLEKREHTTSEKLK
ncbi:capsule biosynthesis protein [Cronobacter turicensis]|jgi:capsular polysaccharide export protein